MAVLDEGLEFALNGGGLGRAEETDDGEMVVRDLAAVGS